MEECQKKQAAVKEMFSVCNSMDEKYDKIIQLGKSTPSLSFEDKVPANIVPGCQSAMYMKSWMEEGRVYFQAESDALISSGLAQLLIMVYSGLPPEQILKCPPTYLEELNIAASLSPNRANGLYSIHLRMKQDALRFLLPRP